MKGYWTTGIHPAATGGSEGRHLPRCVASNRVVRYKLTEVASICCIGRTQVVGRSLLVEMLQETELGERVAIICYNTLEVVSVATCLCVLSNRDQCELGSCYNLSSVCPMKKKEIK